MILQDVYTEIANRCSLDETVTNNKTRMLSAVNNQLRRLFLNTDLPSERESFTLTTVEDQYLYRLDGRVLRSINFRETNSPARLEFESREDFENDYPYPASTETGVPSIFVPMRKVRVTNQPTAASVIAVVSDSGSDITSYYVIIKGYTSAGLFATDKITLTGSTPANSTTTFASLISISKDTTNGTVTCTSNSGAVTNISLLAAEKQKEMWEIRLHKIPDDEYTIPYSAQVIPWLMTYDEDALPIPDEYVENFLASVTSEVLFIQGDAKVGLWDQKAETLKNEIKDMAFMAKDEDLRFGFGELDYEGDFE